MKRRISAVCTACDRPPKEAHADLEPAEIFPWLLNLHAMPPHTNHAMSIRVDGEERVSEEGGIIEITCLKCNADPTLRPRSYKKHVAPVELVASLLLMMHAEHEGHQLKLVIDGKAIGV